MLLHSRSRKTGKYRQSPDPDFDVVLPMIVDESNHRGGLLHAIDNDSRAEGCIWMPLLARFPVSCLQHVNMIGGFPIAIMDLVLLPVCWKTGFELQRSLLQLESEQRLKHQAI